MLRYFRLQDANVYSGTHPLTGRRMTLKKGDVVAGESPNSCEYFDSKSQFVECHENGRPVRIPGQSSEENITSRNVFKYIKGVLTKVR